MFKKVLLASSVLVGLLFSGIAKEGFADVQDQNVTVVAPAKKPVGWWKFDGNVRDSAGSNHGVENGSPAYAAGISGQAISFDGKDDFIVVADNGGSATVEFGTGSFSIAFWVKSNFEGVSNSDIKEYIICNGTNGTEFDSGGSGPGGRASGKRYVITFEDDDLCFLVDDDATKTLMECASDDFATGDWVHVVAIRNTDAKQLLIYRNGVLEVSKIDNTTGSIASPGEPLFIGAKQKEDAYADVPANAPIGYFFKGMLDDLRIYDYALSQGEIMSLSGKKAGEKVLVSFPSAEVLFEKARRRDKARKFEESKDFYEQIIQHYPDRPEADRAKLDISKIGVLSIFDTKFDSEKGAAAQDAAAQAALDRFIANFSKHPYLPEALYSIAERYQNARKNEQAEALYQKIATNYPDTDYAFKSLKKLTILYVDAEKGAEVRQACDKLTQNFSRRPELADALYEVAERYEWSKGRYKEAQTIYQQIIQQFPDSSYAKLPLALARTNVISLIEQGNYSQAQQDINKLVAKFSRHPDLARTLDGIAGRYGKAGKYDEAKAIYRKIAIDYPGTDHALQAQKKLVFINIKEGDDIAARETFDKLIADFRYHRDLPDIIFEIGMESQDLKAGKNDQARTIYNKILTDYPGTDRALQAQKKLVFIDIEEGNDIAALATLDKLIADFKYHRELPDAIFTIGKEYYNKACQHESQGLADEAKDRFKKAIVVWEKVITQLSYSDHTLDAYYFSADCYNRLGEYEASINYCKMVLDYPDFHYAWNSLRMIGQNYENLKELGLLSKSEADLKIKAAYEQLLKRYHNCPEAGYAQSWIDQYNALNNKGENK